MPADPVLEFLTEEAELWRTRFPGWRFPGLAGLLVEYGRRFQPGDPPRRKGGWHRAIKACFRNAYLNVLRDPDRYVYCEGYCWSSCGPIHHAWFAERRSPDIALDTTLPKRDPEDEYYGVEVQFSNALRTTMAAGSHGSILEGGILWPPGGPPIYAGVDPPELFLERF